MKRQIVLFILLVGVWACQPEPDMTPGVDSGEFVEVESPEGSTTCTMTGGPVYAKTGGYNCHEYVRAALIETGSLVNTTTGKPVAQDFSNLDHNTIQGDHNFIRLCNSDASHAEVAAYLPISRDHSSLRLDGGTYAYSTPGGSDIYTTLCPRNYGSTPPDYEWYSSIEDVQISGPVISGNRFTFTLNGLSNHPYIVNEPTRWSYTYSGAFTLISETNTQLVIERKAGWSGTHTVYADLNTTATNGSCSKGALGVEDATTYTPRRSKSFTLPTDCQGSLNGSNLNTWNSIPKYVTNYVVMNESGWSWTKTSGSASWSTSNNGKNMNISMYYGSATFLATKAGCSNRTITFSAY